MQGGVPALREEKRCLPTCLREKPSGKGLTRMPSPPQPPSPLTPQRPYKIGAIDVVPADAALGAEIKGLDLAALADELMPLPETMDAIRRAWATHFVLVWRNQDLSVAQHVALGRQFGELENMSHVAAAPDLPPEILVIENDPMLNQAAAAAPEDYRAGFKDKAVVWHSDNSYRPIPPAGSLFYQREGPAEGGATHFCNMSAALSALPEELRHKIEGRAAIHDPSHNSAGVLRKGAVAPVDVSQGTGPRHPLIRTHPVTGRQALYLGRRPYSYVEGYSVAESEDLLDRLWKHAAQNTFVWHRPGNRPGDVFLWDNRCVMHCRDALASTDRRLAHRVQILGEQILGDAPLDI